MCGRVPKMNSKRVKNGSEWQNEFRMECKKCGQAGPWSDTTALAVAGWNREAAYAERHEDPGEDARSGT